MTTKVDPKKNGEMGKTMPPQNEVKKAEKLTPEQKKDAQETVKKILGTPITPEQRLSGLKVLNKLSEKVEHLRKLTDDFNLFVASSDETACKLTLENSQGFKFSVSNSQTLNRVIELVGKDLDGVSKKAESEFLNFTI